MADRCHGDTAVTFSAIVQRLRTPAVHRLNVLTLSLATALIVSAARADAPSAAEEAAIHALISSQISAFGRDDGPAAYAFASPGIQSRFPAIGDFMAMVSGLYQPIYHPRSVAFGALVDIPGGPVQRVFLVGRDGLGYSADYLMEKQPDGSWRIDGVNLMRNDQPSI